MHVLALNKFVTLMQCSILSQIQLCFPPLHQSSSIPTNFSPSITMIRSNAMFICEIWKSQVTYELHDANYTKIFHIRAIDYYWSSRTTTKSLATSYLPLGYNKIYVYLVLDFSTLKKINSIFIQTCVVHWVMPFSSINYMVLAWPSKANTTIKNFKISHLHTWG